MSKGKSEEESLADFQAKTQRYIDVQADVVQAGDFSAVAIWTTSDVTIPQPTTILNERVARVFKQTEECVERHIGDRKHYVLRFLARDPESTVQGAVSAVVRPWLEKVKQEGVIAYLFAADEHCRKVYKHYGFKEYETLKIGAGEVNKDGVEDSEGEGHSVYFMIYNA